MAKVVEQSDILQGKGMIKEVTDYHDKTGDFTLWTNAMFGGMPTYQISSPQNSNLIRKVRGADHAAFLKGAYKLVFCSRVLFLYVLMLVMDVNQVGGRGWRFGICLVNEQHDICSPKGTLPSLEHYHIYP